MIRVYQAYRPPKDPPSFSHTELEGIFRSIYQNDLYPLRIKNRSLHFMRYYSPSERDQHWKLEVESFIAQVNDQFSTISK